MSRSKSRSESKTKPKPDQPIRINGFTRGSKTRDKPDTRQRWGMREEDVGRVAGGRGREGERKFGKASIKYM